MGIENFLSLSLSTGNRIFPFFFVLELQAKIARDMSAGSEKKISSIFFLFLV
jgi:hypothetical protein